MVKQVNNAYCSLRWHRFYKSILHELYSEKIMNELQIHFEGINYECKIYYLFTSHVIFYSHWQSCSNNRIDHVLVSAVKLNSFRNRLLYNDEHNET